MIPKKKSSKASCDNKVWPLNSEKRELYEKGLISDTESAFTILSHIRLFSQSLIDAFIRSLILLFVVILFVHSCALFLSYFLSLYFLLSFFLSFFLSLFLSFFLALFLSFSLFFRVIKNRTLRTLKYEFRSLSRCTIYLLVILNPNTFPIAICSVYMKQRILNRVLKDIHSLVRHFLTWELKFYICKRPCNLYYSFKISTYINIPMQ